MKSILLAFVLLFSLAFASRASANECGGTLIDYKPAWHNGQKVGELALYYNGANGNNCAVFNHAGPTWGQTRLTWVEVYVCKPGGYGNCAIWQWSPWWSKDEGWYAYRAGPVRVYGQGHCVEAAGEIKINGTGVYVSSGRHCR